MTILGRLAVPGFLAGALCLHWLSWTFAQPYPSNPVGEALPGFD